MNNLKSLPKLTVEVEGLPLSPTDARTLGSIRIQQRLSLPTLCEMIFIDPVGPLNDAASMAPGSRLEISAQGQAAPLFSGQITAVEYVYEPSRGRQTRVRGYDLLHRLRKRQPVRAHVQVTVADLAREMTADLGVTVDAAETGPLFQRLIQHAQSDFELLAEVAERCGLYFTLRKDSLRLLTLEGTGEALPLALGDSLLEARVEINSDSSCQTVSAEGWDPWRVERHEGSARDARVGREIEARVSPDEVGGTGERLLVGEILQNDQQAEAMAQAELDVRVAREVSLWAVAEGDTRLQPGAVVEIKGVAAPLAGRYVLTAVNHIIDGDKGFISEITTVPPAIRARAKAAVAAPGVVTRIDDPDDLGRVRVSLPTYGNVETDWMGVITAGAGAGKGMITLPDVGDHVLVLFAGGDPAQGVVIGGLYGVQAAPDWGLEEGAVKRYNFLTPGGQRVRLDDSRKLVRVENSEGSYVELSPEKFLLHAQSDLEIEAPGRSITIRGQAIDFERG